MDGISKKIKDAETFLKQVRKSPFHTVTALFVLAAAVSAGAFLKSYFEKLGDHGATATIEVWKSGNIGKLLPSRITSLTYRVSVINLSTQATDEDVKKVVAALQDQVHKDFAPIWGVDAELAVIAKGKQPEAHSWWLAIRDDSEVSGDWGWHGLTGERLPYSKIFLRQAKEQGVAWSVVASRELLGMLVDPRVNLTAFVPSPDGTSGTVWAYEVTFPCGTTEGTYKNNDVLVSDFVTPAWFDASVKPSDSRFDFLGKINKPLTLLPGGSAWLYEITSGSGWKEQRKQ